MPHSSKEPILPVAPPWSGREFLILVGLCLLVVYLAWPGMQAGLVLDDLIQMDHVGKFRSWSDAFASDSFGLLRPVKNLLYYLFYLEGLPSLLTWHGINLAIYLASVVGVHSLVRSISRSPNWALLATTFWATSATQASTAIWMSCFNISLAMVFACATLLFHECSWAEASRKWHWTAAWLCLFLAEVSYETAVCVAPLCVLVDWFRGRSLFSRRGLSRYAGLFLTTVGFLILRKLFGAIHTAEGRNLGFDPAIQDWQVIVSAPWFLWRHFSMWFSPIGRIEFVSTYIWGVSASPWELALAWMFLALVLTGIWITHKRLPLVAFGLGWYLVASFPTSNLIPIRVGPIEDYYLVFPSVGLAVSVVGLLQAALTHLSTPAHSSKMRLVLQPTTVIFAMLLTLLSRGAGLHLFRQQAALWNDSASLYLVCAESRPAQYLAKALASRELLRAGDLEHARQLAWEAEREGPWQIISPIVLGQIAGKEGDFALATVWFQKACARCASKENMVDYCQLLKAQILRDQKKTAEAREELLVVLKNPQSDFHYMATLALTELYVAEGNQEKALQTLSKSLALHPHKAASLNLALARVKSGNIPSILRAPESPVQR